MYGSRRSVHKNIEMFTVKNKWIYTRARKKWETNWISIRMRLLNSLMDVQWYVWLAQSVCVIVFGIKSVRLRMIFSSRVLLYIWTSYSYAHTHTQAQTQTYRAHPRTDSVDDLLFSVRFASIQWLVQSIDQFLFSFLLLNSNIIHRYRITFSALQNAISCFHWLLCECSFIEIFHALTNIYRQHTISCQVGSKLLYIYIH